jgi:hypothetical protein
VRRRLDRLLEFATCKRVVGEHPAVETPQQHFHIGAVGEISYAAPVHHANVDSRFGSGPKRKRRPVMDVGITRT